jgi:cytochrome c oxidase subunit III
MELNRDMEQGFERKKSFQPQKFALWLSLASITMMFVALTSAYIVRKSAGNWLEFTLPTIFFISTFVILASSLTLHLSYKSYLSGNEKLYKNYMLVTFILGMVFIGTQYFGWQEMNNMGIYLDGNPSGGFVFAISGLHAVHVLGGLGALTVAMFHAFRLRFYFSEKRKARFQMINHYWHFVDALWVYLIIFFMFQ